MQQRKAKEEEKLGQDWLQLANPSHHELKLDAKQQGQLARVWRAAVKQRAFLQLLPLYSHLTDWSGSEAELNELKEDRSKIVSDFLTAFTVLQWIKVVHHGTAPELNKGRQQELANIWWKGILASRRRYRLQLYTAIRTNPGRTEFELPDETDVSLAALEPAARNQPQAAALVPTVKNQPQAAARPARRDLPQPPELWREI